MKQLAAEVNTQAIAGFTTDEQVFLMRLLIRVLHNLEGEQGAPAARVFARYERYTK